MRVIAPYLFGGLLAVAIFYGLALSFGVGPQALVLLDHASESAIDFGQGILQALWNLITLGAS